MKTSEGKIITFQLKHSNNSIMREIPEPNPDVTWILIIQSYNQKIESGLEYIHSERKIDGKNCSFQEQAQHFKTTKVST